MSIGGTASVGSATAIVSATADRAVYTVEISGVTGSGSVDVSIPAASAINGFDQPNTTSNTASVTFDRVGPVARIGLAPGQADKASGVPVKSVVRFDEAVSGFAADDVSASGTANPSDVTVSGTGAEYIVTIGGVEGDGTVVLDVAEGAVTDAIGNGSTTLVDANSVTIASPGGVLPDTGHRSFPFREALLLIFAGLVLLLVSRRRRRNSFISAEVS